MGFVIAGGALLVQTQFSLDSLEVCLTYQGRESGHEGPRLRRCGVSACSGFAYGVCGRAATTSRTQLLSVDVDIPGIRGIGEQATQGGTTPAALAAGRLHAKGQQILGQAP